MQTRDSQRSRVYKWEWEVEAAFEKKRMSLAEVKSLAGRVLTDYGLPPEIEVTDGRGRRRGCASANQLRLPRFARTLQYVLHEMAHVVIQRDGCGAWHGPEFVRVYVDLAAHYAGARAGDLLKSARAAGIKVAQHSQAPRRASREEKRLIAAVRATHRAWKAACAALDEYRHQARAELCERS